jgi:hypothetical protein
MKIIDLTNVRCIVVPLFARIGQTLLYTIQWPSKGVIAANNRGWDLPSPTPDFGVLLVAGDLIPPWGPLDTDLTRNPGIILADSRQVQAPTHVSRVGGRSRATSSSP